MKKEKDTVKAPEFEATPYYFLTVLLSWLLPGAGHILLGYRVRGLLIGGALLGTFWLGEAVLADNMAVTRQVHPIFFCLQIGNGGSTLLANELWGEPVDRETNTARINRDLPKHLNLGILFCTVSGLLNLLVVLHILDPRTWTEVETAPTPAGGESGQDGQAPARQRRRDGQESPEGARGGATS